MNMRTPKYYFTNDFSKFEDFFFSQPHKPAFFEKGSYIWRPGDSFHSLYYICSGIMHHSIQHENGYNRITSFHGEKTVFPGHHMRDYKLEKSIYTVALTDVSAIEFSKYQFQKMFESNTALASCVIDWYSDFANLLLYEASTAYDSSFEKLCSALYILFTQSSDKVNYLENITQADLSELLGVSLVNITRALSRLRSEGVVKTKRNHIKIIDIESLEAYSSFETL